MEKRLKNLLARYGDMDVTELEENEREKEKQALLVQIQFLQHERFVHLLVTVLFALLFVGTLFVSLMVPSLVLFLLMFAFLVLLVPYIRHYYILENGVQKLYEYYDRL